METTDDFKNESDGIVRDAEEYFKMQVDYLKLDLIERLTRSLADLVFLFVIVFFVFAAIFLLCLASVLITQQIVGNWIVSSIVALALFVGIAWGIFTYGKPRLKDAIAKALIKSAYE